MFQILYVYNHLFAYKYQFKKKGNIDPIKHLILL